MHGRRLLSQSSASAALARSLTFLMAGGCREGCFPYGSNGPCHDVRSIGPCSWAECTEYVCVAMSGCGSVADGHGEAARGSKVVAGQQRPGTRLWGLSTSSSERFHSLGRPLGRVRALQVCVKYMR